MLPSYFCSKILEKIRAIPSTARNLRRISLRSRERILRGTVLLSYVLDPFLIEASKAKRDDPVIWHSNGWECRQMAATFLSYGFHVDVIHFNNRNFIPDKDYALCVDSRRNLPRLSAHLSDRCIRVMHIDAANTVFQDTAEFQRVLALQQRRGVTLLPRRYEPPNLNIEHADCGVMLGNDFTAGTFSYAGKPLFRVPVSSSWLFEWPETKDWDACRRTFLWFGSSGLVHKGLDLVLEAFSKMPGYQLVVCGPITGEPDFENEFRQELYHSPNIQTIGWMDLTSPWFPELAARCAGMIFPSCSEGQSGSVVTAMHAGLIPICSYQCGVDVEPFGEILPENTVPAIRAAVERVASLPAALLRERARATWSYARVHHTRENFAVRYQEAIGQILDLGREGLRKLPRPAATLTTAG